MCEKDMIAVSADDDGTVLMLMSGSGAGAAWRDNPARARWLAMELIAAADRADARTFVTRGEKT